MPHHSTTRCCCCCPQRVNNKEKYHIIGTGTVNKIQPHAQCKIRVDSTRVCNECYNRITRNKKKTVRGKWRDHSNTPQQLPHQQAHTSQALTLVPQFASVVYLILMYYCDIYLYRNQLCYLNERMAMILSTRMIQNKT